MLSSVKVILNNVQVMEWEKVAEDWIRAGRQLMVLHYEEVTNVLSNIGFYIWLGVQDFLAADDH